MGTVISVPMTRYSDMRGSYARKAYSLTGILVVSIKTTNIYRILYGFSQELITYLQFQLKPLMHFVWDDTGLYYFFRQI